MSVCATLPKEQTALQVSPERAIGLRALLWVVVLVGAGLTQIVCSEFGVRPATWLPPGETFLLVCVADYVARIRAASNVCRFILAIAAASFAWRVAVPWIETSAAVHSFAEQLSWPAQFFLSRLIRTIGVPLMALTLLGSGIRTQDLFLRVGDLSAVVRPEWFLPLKGRMTWARFTLILMVVLTGVLGSFLFFALHPKPERIQLLLLMLPWAVITSVVNASNEEFQFRSLLLAQLQNAVEPKTAVLLVAAFFGVGHYFGQPAGWPGVLMAGSAGWIWAKSMVETRGFVCAFLIHFVMDFVIYGFLVLSGTGFPGS